MECATHVCTSVLFELHANIRGDWVISPTKQVSDPRERTVVNLRQEGEHKRSNLHTSPKPKTNTHVSPLQAITHVIISISPCREGH